MNTDQLGYKISDDSKEEYEGTDTESLKDDREEYPSDEELKHGYTFIQKKRYKKASSKKVILEKEDYVSE
tara:strand:+ start:631 stop:840 length:210 start_codon:yes stop_codon:yes gene_type:complete